MANLNPKGVLDGSNMNALKIIELMVISASLALIVFGVIIAVQVHSENQKHLQTTELNQKKIEELLQQNHEAIQKLNEIKEEVKP